MIELVRSLFLAGVKLALKTIDPKFLGPPLIRSGFAGSLNGTASGGGSFIWISPFLWPGYAMILGSHAWMAARAFKESPLHGLLFSLVPPYAIFYGITRWERMRVPSLIQLFGWITVFFSIKIIWNGF